MLRCFWGNARKFKSAPLDGTENDSTQLLMNSSVNRVLPPFSGTSASQSKKPIKNLKLQDKTKKKNRKICLPTILGREDLLTGPFKLTQ